MPTTATCATGCALPEHIHIFEPTGAGGIFQHSCDVAQLLTQSGRRVTLHTARQHEQVEIDGVEVCRCVWWPRSGPGLLRRLAIATRLLASALPHLHRAAGRGSLMHVEGGVASGALTVLTLWVARRRKRRVVYSPHNTFSRRGPLDTLALGAALGFSDAVVAYSQRDAAVLRSRGPDAFVSPLVQLVPDVPESSREAWRERWKAQNGERVVLFAGFLREDKRLDLLIQAARDWPEDRRLAVVGEDRGSWNACEALADQLGVKLHADVGFASLDEFTAALAAADLVVAPYERASQSGVLSISRQLGVATLAADVGGLSELADRTFPSGDVEALGAAVDASLEEKAPSARALDDDAALAAHVAAYAAAARNRGRQPPAGRRPRVAIVLWGPSASRADEFAAELDGEGWTFYDLGIVNRRAIPLRYLISALRTVGRLVRRRPESLVVVNPPIFPALICLAYSNVARVPIVLDSHTNSFGQKSSVLGRRTLWLTRLLARRVNGTLVGTPELARRVEEWGGAPLIVHEAPPIWSVRLPARDGHRFSILWAGIFAPDEPVDAVIEAARLLPDVEFRISGDLRRAPIPLHEAPPNVVWLGFLRGEAYHREVQAADAVIALTVDTTSALRAAAESIYHLRPLVTSDLPHLRELFPSAIFVANDSDGIAAGVRAVRERSGSLAEGAEAERARLLAQWELQRDDLERLLDIAPTGGAGKRLLG